MTAAAHIKDEASELRLLFEVSQALEGATELADHLDEVLALMASRTGMMRGALYLLSPDRREVIMEAAYGIKSAERNRGRYKLGEGVIGRVMTTGRPMVVPKVSEEPLFLNRTRARNLQKEEISFVCVPISLDEVVVGALSADRLFAETVLLEEDLRLLTILASLVARAVRIRRDFKARHAAVVEENRRLQAILRQEIDLDGVVGRSPAWRTVLAEAAQVADSRTTVLLRGESGTGKEVVAGLIQAGSPRSGHPFIKVNCAALPESLVESELFGHERGAFTGAVGGRLGRFEMAHGGTLFLDEVGDMSQASQVKLLRVLQEKEFERVGGSETIKVDVRVIAATNRDLEAMVEGGSFRRDLYYRLNVFPILLPPLRARREDLENLAHHFLKKFSLDPAHPPRLSAGALRRLRAHNWPGNIRELENAMERAALLRGAGLTVEEHHLPDWPKTADGQPPATLEEAVGELERRLLSEALEAAAGRLGQAAARLGLTERKMGLRLAKYQINYRRFRRSRTEA